MEKTIEVDGREIRIKACASTAIRYQQVYKEHVDGVMLRMAEKDNDGLDGGIYEMVAKLFYIMAWHCDPNLKLDYESAMEWLDHIGSLSGEAVKTIVSLFFRK